MPSEERPASPMGLLNALEIFKEEALDETEVEVTDQPSNMYGFNVDNSESGHVSYLNLFDGDTYKLSILLPIGAVYEISPYALFFNNLKCSITQGRNDGVAPDSAMYMNIFYEA